VSVEAPAKSIFCKMFRFCPLRNHKEIFSALWERFRFLQKRNFREWPVSSPKHSGFDFPVWNPMLIVGHYPSTDRNNRYFYVVDGGV